MKIAVCDDDQLMLQEITKQITTEFIDQSISCNATTFSCGEKLITEYQKSPFDVVFLDIVLPGMNGFDVAAELRKSKKQVQIIFITTEESMVYDSFEFQPFSFIPKIPLDQFQNRLSQVIKSIKTRFKNETLIVLSLPHGEQKRFYIQDLAYIYSEDNYLRYCFSDKSSVLIREKMKDAALKYNTYSLIRIHNRYLINLIHINKFDFVRNTVLMCDGTVLDVSRAYRENVKAEYNNYLRLGK